MKQLVTAFALSTFLSSASAQYVSFESVRLAEFMASNTWQSLEQSLPIITSGFEAQLKSNGVTEEASKVLAEEFRRSMTQENMTRALAQMLTESFSNEEIKDLNLFMQSKLGQKYLQINKEMSNNVKMMTPIFRQTCISANSQLSSLERSSIAKFCSHFLN